MKSIFTAKMWRRITISATDNRWTNVLKRVRSTPFHTRKQNFTSSQKNEAEKSRTSERIVPVKMSYSSFESGTLETSPLTVPIIIMHGFLGSRQNWMSVSKVIHSNLKTKVISVDARNHGDSPHSSNIAYSYLAEDIRLLMSDLKIPQASLIGHSMGGRAMMLVALKYPELVRNLVVVDISPIGVSNNMHVMPRYLNAMKNVRLPPNVPLSAARKQAEKQMAVSIQDVDLVRFLLTNLIEGDSGQFHWRVNINDLGNKFGELATFPNIATSFTGRTLFVGGADSDYIKPEEHSDIRRYFPYAEFQYVHGAGHWVHAEKPTEFISIVCKFLAQQI